MAKAAADLSISQPSVSKAIADVEHVLGLRLFDRGPRGIEPTIYGRALVNCGTAVFDELRQGVKQLELSVSGGFITMLPSSMLHFGKHLALKRLPVATAECAYSIGIVTLKNRTLAPVANVFIDNAREIAKPLTKRGFQ